MVLMLWLYLTALVILIGGGINAVLQEFTDPETAEAGATKAAAKAVIDICRAPASAVSGSVNSCKTALMPPPIRITNAVK